MGMFDSLMVGCVCGETIEFQSKAGDCGLEQYDIGNVPTTIAADLDGEEVACDNCGRVMKITVGRPSINITYV